MSEPVMKVELSTRYPPIKLVTLEFPTTEEQVDTALKATGVPYFGCWEIASISSPIHILELLDYEDSTDVLNEMARAAEEAEKNGQAEIFSSFLDSHREETACCLLADVQHLDCYEVYPGNVYQYAREVFARKNPGADLSWINWPKYRDALLADVGGRETLDGKLMLPKTHIEKFYVPLKIRTETDEDRTRTVDHEGGAAEHEEAIRKAVADSVGELTVRGGLADFMDIHDDECRVMSIFPTVETHGGELWGLVDVTIRGWLPDGTMQRLKENITGQLSDGWGEVFEQQPVQTGEGPLYVSFWQGSGWRLFTEEEFQEARERAMDCGPCFCR